MKVLKFGGTSVGSAERIRKLVPLIQSPEPKIVVLSAMSGTTNSLVEIARLLFEGNQEKAKQAIEKLEMNYQEVIRELFKTDNYHSQAKELLRTHFDYLHAFGMDMFTPNEEKAILAKGELLSTALLHYHLSELGIPSVLLPALNFMRIGADEEPDLKYIEDNLILELKKYPESSLFVTQGYICRDAFGEIDNLKRGGSDYTATLIGAALRVQEIQIWTDIDGMHNNDPRIVEKTHPVTELSFDEAAELAYFGAKILHPTCVLPAQQRKIPLRLLNTMQPDAKGTLISEQNSGERFTAVAAKDGITAIKIKSGRMLLAYGFLRAVFEVFERYKTPIDMITTSEVAVSVTIDQVKNLDAIVNELQAIATVEVDKDLSIICIVGSFAAESEGCAIQIFESLRSIPIRMISYGGSECNVSLLVKTAHKKETLQALNEGLF
jgi:aspartate kinase